MKISSASQIRLYTFSNSSHYPSSVWSPSPVTFMLCTCQALRCKSYKCGLKKSVLGNWTWRWMLQTFATRLKRGPANLMEEVTEFIAGVEYRAHLLGREWEPFAKSGENVLRNVEAIQSYSCCIEHREQYTSRTKVVFQTHQYAFRVTHMQENAATATNTRPSFVWLDNRGLPSQMFRGRS